VYNYRFLKAALRREVERAARYGHVFSVIMIDVDHLKLYNEVHGHLQGSEVLRRLAAILAGSSRAIDLVAKYGGDEFLIILPQTRADGAMIMGGRICESVAAATFPHCRCGDMTVSVGVASFPEHGTTMETLLAAADEALFRAKRAGRNCVQVAEAPGHPGRTAEVA
jgi:diguanylate cyclase (GGDEF)-like protein